MADPLNTIPIQQFISQVKTADASNQREIRLQMSQARNLAYTLGIVMSRLEGDLEKLVAKKDDDQVIQVNMDGGGNWK